MQFEKLYQDLVHGAEIIRTLTLGVTQEEACSKPDPESWSILEVICHLYDLEREDFRPRLDIILHHPGEKWRQIDPENWIASRHYNERNLAETMEGFLAERSKSIAWLKSLSNPNWMAEYQDEGGTMPAGEMLTSWVAHDNLHTRQLVELRRFRLMHLVAPFDVNYAGEW